MISERRSQLHALLDALLDRAPVWIWLKSDARWHKSTLVEIRSSGTTVVRGKSPGHVYGVEPGEVRLTDPLAARGES